MGAQETSDRQLKIESLAEEILRLAHDGLLINMRFLDVALSKLKLESRPQTGTHLLTEPHYIMTRCGY